MSFLRDWETLTPTGTEAASKGDDRLRNLKVDIGERLEDILYGFNASSAAGQEDLYGVKKLRMREQSADPTVLDTDDEVNFYAKNVSGVTELFVKNNASQVKQLTSGGKLNVVDADGAVMKTGVQTVAGAKEFTGIATLADGSLLKTSAAPTTDPMIANKKFVDDSVAGAATTVNDSESNAMAKAHAYLTQTSGFVNTTTTGLLAIRIYVGATNDPAGAGQIMDANRDTANGPSGANSFVPKGKYFEVTDAGSGTTTIVWTPLIAGGGAPIDQD